MMEEFWVAKYALTGEVFRIAGSLDGVRVSEALPKQAYYGLFLSLGKDVFRTKKEAIERAIVLATKKISANNKKNAELDNKIDQWIRML